MTMIERRDATQRTWQRFAGKPFVWGEFDCGKMILSHLREMGYAPKMGPQGSWTSAAGAARFVRRHGGSIAACLDKAGLLRIAPASVLLGDVVELPGEPPFGAFGIALDNGRGRVMAYHQDAEGAVAMQGHIFLYAWRL